MRGRARDFETDPYGVLKSAEPANKKFTAKVATTMSDLQTDLTGHEEAKLYSPANINVSKSGLKSMFDCTATSHAMGKKMDTAALLVTAALKSVTTK